MKTRHSRRAAPVLQAEAAAVLPAEEAAGVQAHAEVLCVLLQLSKGLWSALEQLVRKAGAVVRHREGEKIPLPGEGDGQGPPAEPGPVPDEIFRRCQEDPRACLTSPRARLGGVFSALTALKILAIRQDACGFLPCKAKNPLANPHTLR